MQPRGSGPSELAKLKSLLSLTLPECESVAGKDLKALSKDRTLRYLGVSACPAAARARSRESRPHCFLDN